MERQMKHLPAALIATALCLSACNALAQAYPAKPIRMVVPFPPGGAVDLTARLLQQRLGTALGQPVIIDNRAGAGGMIGAEQVSRAAPDGYALVYTVGTDLAMRRWLSKAPTVDPVKELTPIASVLESVGCIAVSAALPIGSMKELIELARRNPGRLNYASTGINSPQHLTGELLRQHGVDMTHVPFSGTAPGVVALLGGQIEVAISNIASVYGPVREGKVRLLAVTRPSRYEDAPDVPTLAEVIPGFNVPVALYGLFGPPALPSPIVARIAAETGKAMEASEVIARAKELYMSANFTPPEQFAATLRNAAETYGRIVKAAGIQPQ
jgi:tripartite-type tricarboxylate transporter receptor subunit TctC